MADPMDGTNKVSMDGAAGGKLLNLLGFVEGSKVVKVHNDSPSGDFVEGTEPLDCQE